MTFQYCPDCEVRHAPGACELVEEFYRQHDAITEEQLALSFGLRCEWRAGDGCNERAAQRVVIVGPSGFMIEDRVLCDEHAMTTSLADSQPGYRVTSWLLDDPADPKLVIDTPDISTVNAHVHSRTTCPADVEGPSIWWLCGHEPMFTPRMLSGDPDNPTLPEDRDDMEAHDAQNALAELGAYDEGER